MKWSLERPTTRKCEILEKVCKKKPTLNLEGSGDKMKENCSDAAKMKWGGGGNFVFPEVKVQPHPLGHPPWICPKF